MRRFLIAALMMFSTLSVLSQNGGQANQNAVIRIDYLGTQGGTSIFQVTNKQACSVNAEYAYQGSQATSFTLPGAGTYIISVQGLGVGDMVKARANTFCPATVPDRGWVESVVASPPLPVKFKSLSGERLGDNLIRIAFEVEEDSDIRYYNIKVSTDGKSYRVVTMVFPDGLFGSKKYTINIAL